MNPAARNFYLFEEFRLDANEKVLWRGNSIVDATPKAVEILLVLVERAGAVVSKEEILRLVWLGSFVEEANLSHHIFRLRKALGETEGHKFIETVPRRGYRFIAKVENRAPSPHASRKYLSKRISAYFAGAIVLSALVIAGIIWLRPGTNRQQDQNQNKDPKAELQDSMAISRITSSGKAAAPGISPDGKFIAYTNYTPGNAALFIRETATNIETQLLAPGERNIGTTAFSPEGTSIYYVVFDASNPDGALYRISVLGGEPRRVLSNMGSMFTLSHDGRRAAFYRFDAPHKQTKIMDVALDAGGGEEPVFTFDDDKKTISGVPAFSPDGKMIAFVLRDDDVDLTTPHFKMFTVELGGSGKIQKISDETWTEVGMMNWMPDGTGIVFVGNRPRTGNQIYFLSYPDGSLQRITRELGTYGNYGMGITADGKTMVADLWEGSSQIWRMGVAEKTTTAVQLTSGDNDGGRGLASFPDGEIIYSSGTGFDYDLWSLLDRNGKLEGKPLTSDAFIEIEAAASPNGKFVVFVSDRGGSQHLFRADANGSNLRQLTVGDSIDSTPDISPDGNWIVYASLANNENRIWKIPVDGGIATRLTDYESVAPSFSPDGNSVACVSPSESRAKPARLDIISIESGAVLKSFEVLPFDYYYRVPRWTPDGQAIIFMKNEKQVGNLWKQDLRGGDPIQVTDFQSQLLYNYVFSRDGKWLLLCRGETKVNIVMLKNFKPASGPSF